MNLSLVATAPPVATAQPVVTAQTVAEPGADPRGFAPLTVIEEAIAIVARRSRCTAEEAFALLRTTAHDRRTKLRTVAEDVIESVRTDSPSPVSAEPLRVLRHESYWD